MAYRTLRVINSLINSYLEPFLSYCRLADDFIAVQTAAYAVVFLNQLLFI